jgi:CHASE3 domain sensor protein
MVNTFRRNIILGFCLSLAALIISSAASYVSIQKLLESEQWVEHTSKVIFGLENITSRIKDAETGQRGYLLTGEPEFLEPYTGSKDDVIGYIDEVRQLTADNLDQQKEFPVLDQLIVDKYRFIDKTIAERRRGIPVTITTLLSGKAIMDKIRQLVHRMEKREQQLMETRTSKMNRLAAYTPLLIVFASLVALVVTYAFYRRMKNNLETNQSLQEELERKEQSTQQHIEVISKLADKIAKGDYDTRIDEQEFKR